jgi:hypothetical protein
MLTLFIQRYRTHLLMVVILLGAALFFGLPEFQKKELRSHDHEQYVGGAMEAIKYMEEHNESVYWSRNMFGGMPLYLLHFIPENNLISSPVHKILSLSLPRVSAYYWLAMLGFFVLCITLGLNPITAGFGAISFGLTSYIAVIFNAGHYGKVLAIAYMPWVIAGATLIFRKKYLAGLMVTVGLMSCEMLANHVQMTYYYFAFVISLMGIGWIYEAIRDKDFKHLVIAGSLFLLGIGLGVGNNINKLLPINEYQPFSTRSPSELKSTIDATQETGGLPRSYITDYSHAKEDFWAFLIPNFKGPRNGSLADNKEANKAVKAPYRDLLKSFDQYWGGQDAAGGVIYGGVLVAMLAILALIFVRGWLVWALFAATVLTMMLSLGKRFPELSNWFIDYFPGYNKFRAVNSILVIPQFTLPLMAALMLNRWISEPEWFSKPYSSHIKLPKALSNGMLTLTLMSCVALLLTLFYLSPNLAQDFVREQEVNMVETQAGSQSAQILDVVSDARKAIFISDVLRSLIWLLLGILALWLFIKEKIKAEMLGYFMLIFTLLDTAGVSQRYLNHSAFRKKVPYEAYFSPSKADSYILNDREIGSRVLNLSVSTFNDASTSFFHHSIGGYHGAKMKRYQEFIENRLQKDIAELITAFNSRGGNDEIFKTLARLDGLNMMNTRYLILSPDYEPFPNPMAYGAAWFADEVVEVANADEEITALSTRYNLRKTAIVDKKFAEELKQFSPGEDKQSAVQVTHITPARIGYTIQRSKPGLMVMSEIYYPAGWKAFIDGEPAEHFRANYILRAMIVPEGLHQIEFVFDPESVKKGKSISLFAGLLSLIILGAGAFWLIKKNRLTNKE